MISGGWFAAHTDTAVTVTVPVVERYGWTVSSATARKEVSENVCTTAGTTSTTTADKVDMWSVSRASQVLLQTIYS